MATTWTEETKALKRAVDAGGTLTLRQLAQTLNVSAKELQDRIAMLCFPKRMLQLIDDDVLPWVAARQGLVFVGKDHDHRTELVSLSRRLGGLTRSEYFSGRLTSMQVTRKIHEVIFHGRTADRWQQFDEAMRFGEVAKERPLFDVAAFRKRHGNTLHIVPKLWRKGRKRTFTCAGRYWLAAQQEMSVTFEESSVEGPSVPEEGSQKDEDVFSNENTEDPLRGGGFTENSGAQVRPLKKCTEGLPNDFIDHWHIQWPDQWGSETWLNESPAFLESDMDGMTAFQMEHDLHNWWLVWHEYTRPDDLQHRDVSADTITAG